MAVVESEQLSAEDLAALNNRFEQSTPEEVLTWVKERFGAKAIHMSSFGLEDVALFDMYWRVDPKARLTTLDTWRLPTETYTVMDQTRLRYKIDIEVYQPDPDAVGRMVAEHGFNLFYLGKDNRITCCHVRKVAPLRRFLRDFDGYVTGLRRDQNANRRAAKKVELDRANGGLIKLNPLADWSHQDVMAYTLRHGVPVNRLHAKGYPSVGCAPCTRAVHHGEDPRSGRWWWEDDDAKECGLHVSTEEQGSGI